MKAQDKRFNDTLTIKVPAKISELVETALNSSTPAVALMCGRLLPAR